MEKNDYEKKDRQDSYLFIIMRIVISIGPY